MGESAPSQQYIMEFLNGFTRENLIVTYFSASTIKKNFDTYLTSVLSSTPPPKKKKNDNIYLLYCVYILMYSMQQLDKYKVKFQL